MLGADTHLARQSGTNLPLSVTDALNRTTTYTYDTQGNVLTVTRLVRTPEAVATTLTYEATFSQVATITDTHGSSRNDSRAPRRKPS